MSNYARADAKTQWFQDNYPGSDLNLRPTTMVAVLHTTEGTTWPSYGGGTSAPNYTGQPPVGDIKGSWRAHFPDEKSSRALRNESGGVETNTLNAVQFELIGTCDPTKKTRWGSKKAGVDYVFWPNAEPRQLRWLARILADMHVRHGLRLATPREFKAYPGSYGSDNPNRLSMKAWRATTGIVGHQHVPENSHGDPGNIDMDFVLVEAKKMAERRKP